MREWEWVALAADAAVALLCWKYYKDSNKRAEQVKNAQKFDIENLLPEGKCLEYAQVEGSVKPMESTIKSIFTDEVGVIRNTAFIEHKTKKEHGFWHDTTNTIRDTFTSKQFMLVTGSPECTGIVVEEPLSAKFLPDSLKITYDHFEPTQSTLLAKGLDRIFGDVSKGFQEIEKLLPVGTTLLGFGKVTSEKGVNILQPPDQGQPYVLTARTKRHIIEQLQGSAKFFRILTWMFGIAGMGIAGFIVYKLYRRWKEGRAERALRAEVLRGRTNEGTAEGRGGDGDTDGEAARECVICLSNRREVLLLDCYHLCLCFECSQMLPEPKKCPVCRGDVVGLRSIYLP